MKKFLKALQIGAIVIAWFEAARKDGVVTAAEINELVSTLALAGGWDGDVKVNP